MRRAHLSWNRALVALAPLGVAAAALLGASSAAAEPASCLSTNPADWPPSAKPYFLVIVDTSGSMAACTNPETTWPTTCPTNAPLNSCGWTPTRVADARCALRNTLYAFAGQANFGLASFSQQTATGAPATCSCGLMWGWYAYCYSGWTFSGDDCGDMRLIAPILLDATPPPASNLPTMIEYMDNVCSNDRELYAFGGTPIGVSLQNALTYYRYGYSGSPAPVTSSDPACRPLNVILMTDGGETCDGDPVTAAQALYNGFDTGTIHRSIRTHVIAFNVDDPADQTLLNNIHKMGQCGATTGACANAVAAIPARNEVELSQAFAKIIGGAIQPEVCDNTDNNCNGCTDEGYTHYCDQGQTCCAWSTAAQRTTCLNNYKASITPGDPDGNLALLPCTTPAQQADPATWLCYNPGETCDNVDNNCAGGVDEGVTKCGNPLHCPQAETCNGQDDNCNGVVDEGVCSGCIPSPEVCDGCDNDCDGLIDEGIASVACGFTPPSNCGGTLACAQKSNPGGTPGACVGGGWSACSNNPQTEVCDNVDNDCNGIVDDNVASTSCVPSGTPPGLVYGGTSQCKQGTTSCSNGTTSCNGFVGPSAELCDGVDNDCDGQVDEGAFGVGLSCGINQAPCTPGTTVCVGGALVCQGGVQPQPEVCDGVDNDCDGQTDEAPLADGPGAGLNGCWTLAGNTCSFGSLHWNAPAGATCTGNGTLTSPCNHGTLACQAGAWACVGSKAPSAEVCDNIDNNCDGQVDNGIAQVGQTCGTDTGECTAGTWQCVNGGLSCDGSVGAVPETCNSKDDDCDGVVDNNIQGLGVACGNATPPCTAGVTACVNGAVVCQGGVQPKAETCNGVDDDCDGAIDDAPLSDAPQPGQTGCWALAGNTCSFGSLHWNPPAGATCGDEGTLAPPCDAGTIMCVSGAWACVGAKGPAAEVCDGIDNDCNGAVDDVASVECVPAGTPNGLVYGGKSQCKKGHQTCGTCAGFIGPSAEICDGVDNDCDGVVDDATVGSGQPCGINKPPCTLGQTACVNGALVCQGGVQPTPEVCDGVDNNCNGSVDEAPLQDAPPVGSNGCWTEPGTCCAFGTLTWCPPAGGGCQDNGTLTAPCNKGFLACTAGAWACLNAKGPSGEVCDGIDNDCNGSTDDGNLPGTGDTCGSDVGDCQSGVLTCVNGIVDCAGDVPPTDETCDGQDNNCNGQVDDGIPTGQPCVVPYDTTKYPGDRSQGVCQLGVTECDGNGGWVCQGGTGPQPEVCDGIDNDCDGLVDEDSGKQPNSSAEDVIDGTDNPTGNPAAKVGDPCGDSEGACEPGQWGCRYGVFACLGGKGPEPEQCDCLDNDCDGVVDNENDPGEPALCGAEKKCVTDGNGCQCAAKCKDGEFPCSGGQSCEAVNLSETGEPAGNYCIVNVDLCGGDCTGNTVKDGNGQTVCAPEGTDPEGCLLTPVCKCFPSKGCSDPCTDVTCGTGDVCAKFGPHAGTCVKDTCYMTGCEGCDKACNAGSCVDNPCKAGTCAADEVCKPNATFTAYECVKSCSSVTCEPTQKCVGGECQDWCNPPCDAGKVCDPSTLTCVTDKCGDTNPCTDGSCCDPVTGQCGNCPCEGVLCPAGDRCEAGECVNGGGGTGGAGGTGGTGGTGGAGGTGGGGGTGGSGAAGGGATGGGGPGADAGPPDNRVWGLATGGGGCACRAGTRSNTESKVVLLAGLAAVLVWTRRRSSERAGMGGAR